MSEIVTKSGLKKERSPSFPFITLTKALDRARAIYAASKRHEARMADVADALGSGAKSSGTIQTVAALISFGLLDDSGSGFSRKFKISDLGFKALEDQRPGARAAALREAALKPRLIAEYVETWRDGRPSDSICLSELRIERGFTEDGARAFLRVFDDAIIYAVDNVSNKISPSMTASPASKLNAKSAEVIEIGDLIQWESNGVLKLEKASLVRETHEHDGQIWVFVEGSDTGIPQNEVVIEQKSVNIGQKLQSQHISSGPTSDYISNNSEIEIDRFTLDEGVVRIEFPKKMGIDSVDELEQFFQLFIKKARRRSTR